MKVYLNRVDGIDDAIISMYLSKRTLTRELECDIRKTVDCFTKGYREDGARGALAKQNEIGLCDATAAEYGKLLGYLVKLFKWGTKHITMLKFVDLSFTVYGLHRGAQDDFDSHAKRMDNRIIRASTRLANFKGGEMSEYYQGKIVPTDVALAMLGIETPDEIEVDGNTYVRAANGYILKGKENDNDVKRGLYMLSIPSNFIFRINLTEFAHIVQNRDKDSTAAPELKECVEDMLRQVDDATIGYANREVLHSIRN